MIPRDHSVIIKNFFEGWTTPKRGQKAQNLSAALNNCFVHCTKAIMKEKSIQEFAFQHQYYCWRNLASFQSIVYSLLKFLDLSGTVNSLCEVT